MNGLGVKFQPAPLESMAPERGAPARLLPAGHTFSDQAGDVELSLSRAGSSAARGEDDDDFYAEHTAGSYRAKSAPSPGYILMPDTLFRKYLETQCAVASMAHVELIAPLIQVWTQVTLVAALYVIWVTPVRVGFDWESDGFWFFFEGLIDIFFIVDLVLNFFTAYENKLGEMVMDHRLLAARYLRSWFIVDFLATFPMDYIIRGVEGTFTCAFTASCAYVIPNTSNVDLLKLLKMLRIFRILWIIKHFKKIRISTLLGRYIDDLYKLLPLLSILEILCILLFLGHVSGCFFYFFSASYWWNANERELIDNGQLTTWVLLNFGGERIVDVPIRYEGPPLPANESEWMERHLRYDPHSNATWSCPPKYELEWCNKTCINGPHLRCRSFFEADARYIAAMYWAYTTMSTVGYGDIAAVTISERVWASIVIIFSGFFFSFTIGRMASVVSRLDADRQAREEKIEVVGMFLADTGLPKMLGKRVLDFFKKQKVRGYDWQEVINALPFELKSKILRHLYASAIKSIPLLNREADDDIFLTDICIRLQPFNCSADTFLYQRGESGGDVFILLRGEMLVLDADAETVLYQIAEGTLFGEGTVLRQMEGAAKAKRTENVKSRSPCELFRIEQEDVVDLLEQYPSLHNTFKKIAKAHQRTMMERRGRLVDDELRSMHTNTATPSRFGSGRLPPLVPVDVAPRDAPPAATPSTSPATAATVDLLSPHPPGEQPAEPHLPAPNAPGGWGQSAYTSQEQIQHLQRLVEELQGMLGEELRNQRSIINQLPSKLMTHLVTVIGQPTDAQLERATQVAGGMSANSGRGSSLPELGRSSRESRELGRASRELGRTSREAREAGREFGGSGRDLSRDSREYSSLFGRELGRSSRDVNRASRELNRSSKGMFSWGGS